MLLVIYCQIIPDLIHNAANLHFGADCSLTFYFIILFFIISPICLEIINEAFMTTCGHSYWYTLPLLIISLKKKWLIYMYRGSMSQLCVHPKALGTQQNLPQLQDAHSS